MTGQSKAKTPLTKWKCVQAQLSKSAMDEFWKYGESVFFYTASLVFGTIESYINLIYKVTMRKMNLY